MYFISDYREELLKRYGKGNYRVTSWGLVFIRDKGDSKGASWLYAGEINEIRTELLVFGESYEH